MSKAPSRRPRSGKASAGARAFERRRESERNRSARRKPVKAYIGRRDRVSLNVWGALRRVPTAALRRVPRAAWICVLIAVLNSVSWSLITPPFQGKDEVDHYAYVAQLAENGALPEGGGEENEYSPEQTRVMEGLNYYGVRFSPSTPSLTSVAEQKDLMKEVHAGASFSGTGAAGIATTEPPLYYALEVIPYALGGSSILVKLQLMRLLGVLFAAITVLFTFLFLREILPRVPWAATVGALCVALQPLFAFISGSVNPDSMLYAVSAGVFYCLARAFHRGLSWRLAIALGLLIAIGFTTKLNFIGVAVGVFAGLGVLAFRGARARGREALLAPAIAAAIGVVPVILYAIRNVLTNRPTFGFASGVIAALTHSLFDRLSYAWELYLPRLPGMPHYFVGVMTFKDIWFDRSVGLYGWMDTMFPTWVENVALVPAAAVALLCARELYVRRRALRARLPELGVYGAITVGVLAMIGLSSYSSDVLSKEAAFAEPRYLLPMLPLLGAVVVLAVRGAGRRWAPVAAVAIISLFLAHDLFSQLQVIGRYYG
jgi:hypothetical protein